MPTYDSINAGSFMGTFFKAMALRMEHDKYVQERQLDEGKKDVNTIGMYGMLRARNEHMSDAEFLKEFPGAHSAAMKAIERQGVHKMLAAHSGLMDEEVGVMPVLDPNTGKIILMGKNKDGETVPVTERRSADPDDQVRQFTMMELIDKAYFLAGTKHGLSGFSLDNILASGAVDDSGTQANQTVPAYRAGETQRSTGSPTQPGRIGMQPPGPSSSTDSGTGTRNGDGSGEPAPAPPATTPHTSPDVMTPMPDAQGVVTRQGGLGDHYMHDGDTMHAGPGMPGSPGYTTAPSGARFQDKRGNWHTPKPKRIDTRVIGVDTPEIADPRKGTPAQPYGDAAKAAAQRQLDQAKTITTTPGAGESQSYKRQLSHVDFDGKNLAGEMLDQGMATAMPIGGNQSRADEYAQREADARAAEVGMFEQPEERSKGERFERAARERKRRKIEALEKELARLNRKPSARGAGGRTPEAEAKRDQRKAEISKEIEEIRFGKGDPETPSTEPGSPEFNATELAKTDPEAVEAAAQKDATAEKDTKTIQDIAGAAVVSASKKVAEAQGNPVQAAMSTVRGKDAQNISYGYLLSTDGILASPNKLSPRQRAVVAAALFNKQWLGGALTPGMVSSMRNFVQTGRWLGEAKVLLDHNRGAFTALTDMEYKNSLLLQNERKLAVQGLTAASSLAKDDLARQNTLLNMARTRQGMVIDANQEERAAEKWQLEVADAANTFRDRIRDQITARWESEYGYQDSNEAAANRSAGAQATNDIFQSMLSALAIAALRIGEVPDEQIANLSIGTKAEQDAKSIEALMKATSTGLVPQMQTLVKAYVKYKSKTGSGMVQGMLYPDKDFISFISGDMKGNTFLANDADYNAWLKSSAQNPDRMKIIADAIRVGLQLAPPIRG